MVWSILMDGTEDVDAWIDVRQVGLAELPEPQRSFLTLLTQGYTANEAKELLGLSGTTTQLKRDALLTLTRLVNGERVV